MKRYQLYNERRKFFQCDYSYKMTYWEDFDFDIFAKIMYICRSGNGHVGEVYNDCIIMADTETSKEIPGTQCRNYVVAWTVSVRAFDTNIVTLYGQKPSDFVKCIKKMHDRMPGDKTIIYWHNMSYDWVFIRKFIMREFGTPDKQLNVKSHYPLFINFNNGIMFRDSLILAQRKLEKWAEDMDVEHKKAVGSWNYDLKRNQSTKLSKSELHYIENDTLAGVECIQKTMDTLHKHVYSMPYTATGIPREAVRNIGKEYHARDLFLRLVPDFRVYQILEMVYHGGYTHANRFFISRTVKGRILCLDFSSSYPFCILSEKFPMEKFAPLEKDVDPEYILRNADRYAFIFKLVMLKPELKNKKIPMPALQLSKCTKTINVIEDNGRILQSEYAEIWTNETDLRIIHEQYQYKAMCTEVYFAKKDYLPRWFTDYVFQCYKDKCELKNGDPVLYSIAKAKLNSLYGMCVQKCVKELIEEDYKTGDYSVKKDEEPEEIYNKYVKKYTSILPYQWGVWVTSYAFYNLHTLGKCVADGEDAIWLYSDTDSCYSTKWDDEKVAAYNQRCKDKLKANNYGPVIVNGKEYWLGVAEIDGEYTEFRTVGAKRYSCRKASDQKLKITVAGVPKKGVECLKDNIENFHKDFVFDGETTGKLQHTYYFESDIWIDKEGNERGDSIDLSPTTYILDDVSIPDWDKLWEEEIEMITYEEGDK